ncbi:MAG TPA: tetratricopeptide repeat protein [Terriglobales bacterium]
MPALQAQKSPPKRKASQTARTRTAESAPSELQLRLKDQRAAVVSGNSEAVVNATRRVVALGLLQMATLRMRVGAYAQGYELLRRSLALEDIPATRAQLISAALAAGQYDEVIDQSAKVLGEEPSNARLWYLNGKGWMGKHDYHSAVDSFKRSLALRRDVNTQYALAFSYLKLKDLPAAKALIQSVLLEQGNRPIWHVVFGGAYRDAGYSEEAIAEFRRAVAMDSRVPRGYVYLALATLEANGWAPSQESMKELREALKQDPKDFYANLYLGLQEAQTDQLVESNRHLKAAAEVDPNVADIWLYLGLNSFKQNNYPEARTQLQKAIELTGTNESMGNYEIRRGYIALSRIEFIAGNHEQARKYSEKVRDLKTKAMAEQAEGIAELNRGMGSAPAVVPHAKLPDHEGEGASGPVDATAQLSLPAQTKLTPAEQERMKATEQELRAILSNAFNDWGTADARQGLYPIALQHFKEAEQWDKSTPGVLRNVGLAALKSGDSKEAVRAFSAAVEVDPTDRLSHARLAMLLFNQNDYQNASVHFEALGDAAFVDSAVAYAYAYSLARTNQQKKAIEVLNQLSAMQLPPELLLSVGDLYSVFQDYDHSVACYRKAIQLEPGIPKARYKLGAALIRLSRPAEAIPELQAELAITPNDPDIQFNLAYALLETSQKDKATELLRKITTEFPDYPEAQYQLGKTLLEDGKPEEAISHLEVAAKLDKESDYIHYQLQSAYRRVGRKEDADREAQIYKDIKNRKREAATIPMPERKAQ